VYRKEGPARIFASEAAAIAAVRAGGIRPGDVMVLAGIGPMGTGMEETYQVTSALKHLPFGKHVALLTDARFSGVSTGACIGHVGPEALAVVGFSQGAMVSYEAITQRAAPVAAVVAISGALLYPQALRDATSRPPFLVMHGDDDEVVPFGAMQEACDALVECGFSTEGHVMTRTGHGISEDGVAQALTELGLM
jgi:pimeloyl-ACP methyl ester carboxylesterase